MSQTHARVHPCKASLMLRPQLRLFNVAHLNLKKHGRETVDANWMYITVTK